MSIYVLYVLSGHEQRTADALTAIGIPAFSPVEGCYVHRRGKWVLEDRTLFPGYVFVEVNLTDELYYQLRNTSGVIRLLPSNEKPAPIHEHEVDFVRTLHEQMREPSTIEYLDNHTYRVTSGFLKPHAQRIIKLNRHKRRVSIRLTLLGVTRSEAQRLAQLYPDDKVVQQLLNKLYTATAVTQEEFLKMQLNLIATELYGNHAGITHQTLTEVFEQSYYKGLFDIEQFMGYGSGFNRISSHQIESAITTAWKGKNYSERIWGDHRQSLARYLNRIITNGFIQGTSLQQMRAELEKSMDMSAYEARRLIRTESCQVSNRASLQAYKENGTEQFKFLATLDFKTSVLCRGMDGKVFSVAEARIGTNMPPLHPFCRSTTVPHWTDDYFDRAATRAARDTSGTVYQVPTNMTYKQWHQQHVEPYPKQRLAEQKQHNGRADAAQYKQYQAVLGKELHKSFDDFQRTKYTDVSGWDDIKSFVAYKRKYPESNRHYYEIDKEIQQLKLEGKLPRSIGFAVAPTPIKLYSYGTHALQRMFERGFGTEDASKYIAQSAVEFRQFRNTRSAFYAEHGVAVAIRQSGEMVTGWTNADYRDDTDLIWEVIRKHGK